MCRTLDACPAEIAAAVAALRAPDPTLAAELAAALAAELPAFKRDGGFIRAGYRAGLDETRALRDESRRVLAVLQARYAEDTGIRTLKIRHNHVLGYFIETAVQHGEKLLGEPFKGKFIHRQTLAGQIRFTTNELGDLESKIASAADRALALELEIFDQLADLASLDFVVEGGRHPVVEQALVRGGGPFVANDCDLSPPADAGAGRIWLVTGPNMAGKSTFLRQNALIAVLAQMGSFVPARRARIRSTFMVEMVETAAILNQANERSLVILDEIGRGTATFDGLSIAWATIEHLHEENRCRALFATHFHELTGLAAKLPRLFNATVRVKEWHGEVVFLHEVVPGAADRSYGIQVAKLAGLPSAVIERAKLVLAELEAQDRISPARKLVDELPLFASVRRAGGATPAPRASAAEALLAEIAALDADELSPREALEALYALKRTAAKRE